MHFADRIIGAIAGCLGLACLLEGYRIWSGWRSAGTMLLVVGAIFVVLSLIYFAFTSRDARRIEWPEKKAAATIGIIGISFAIYLIVMPWAGFTISTWIFMTTVAKILSSARTPAVLLSMGGIAVGSYLIFTKVLDSPLPRGLVGF